MGDAGACQTRNVGEYDDDDKEPEVAPLDEVRGGWESGKQARRGSKMFRMRRAGLGMQAERMAQRARERRPGCVSAHLLMALLC